MEASGTSPQLALPDPDEHLPFTIVSQRQTEDLVPPNQWVEVWEIAYTGPSGVMGTVKIPAREYNLQNVNEAIQQQLHTIESVHALGPVPPPAQ
jgi:hypothetical protein